MKILTIEVGISDFNHAVEICEVAFGYGGSGWELIKKTGDMGTLLDMLEADGVEAFIINADEDSQ